MCGFAKNIRKFMETKEMQQELHLPSLTANPGLS